MSRSTDSTSRKRLIPPALAGLAGVACAACCVLPVLLAAGVIGGAGAVALIGIMPTVAVILAVVAVAAWGLSWFLRRRKQADGCAGGAGCGCQGDSAHRRAESAPLQSQP